MKLFEAVHPDLFTVLASPNKELYAGALEVLYEAYQDQWKIPENTLYSMLRGKLERQLADASFEGEDIDEDELRDISGRARFLIRKLCERGWFEKERGKNFEENIIVPEYSSKLLELFHQLTSIETVRGYSYVFDTYSTLKVASEGDNIFEKMTAIYSAYDNTQALSKLLRTVYHNVKRFFQIQIDMYNLNEVLASHYDDFGQKVIESYIRPLKIRDSVPKYKTPITEILNGWLEEDAIMIALSNAALQDKRNDTYEQCRNDIMKCIFWIKEQYERIEYDYLEEIDEQVRRYTRATTQKIENLTNRDQSTRGNLNYLLTALTHKHGLDETLDKINSIFHLYEQTYISEKSLWYRKHTGKREKNIPFIIEEEELSKESMIDAISVISHKYNKAAVSDFVAGLLENDEVCYAKDIDIKDDYTYLMSLLAVMYSYDPEACYKIDILDGNFKQQPYIVPHLKLTRREK